ncbi:MAG: phosphonate transport system transcriptional regulator PhnF [Rhodobacteraceae bacterium HLUCCO18]|nr:MAG: phosphonate transport system transcriptional regulator PhnF [Rhodobacteraceae bacterium HLUCCO18]
MGRPALWISIRDQLGDEIARGHYAPGERLPTEAQLAARFGVNRHTVRRALADLADTGTVHARRGAGVFVQHRQMPYPIGKRVRFHQNLAATGRVPEKRTLMLQTRAASPQEAEALKLAEGARVHVYEGLSFSDEVPIALFRSVFPAERLPEMIAALRETGSVTAAFAAHGIDDYTRARTEITAKPADATLAAQLRLSPGAPILRSVGVNVDAGGTALEYGRTWFAGDRVTLTLGADAL